MTVYDENGSVKNIGYPGLKFENGILDTYGIDEIPDDEFPDVTCELDITEICHRWHKGIVENNGLIIELQGDSPSAFIGDCFLTRRYYVVDAYDPDFTYHSLDMGYAGQVLVNDVTNTITILRNEMYYSTGEMPINLYRYFDFSKTYTDSNPAGTGTHWNYECPLTKIKDDEILWSAFDGRTIKFLPVTDENGVITWSDDQGERYELILGSDSNIQEDNYSNIKISSPEGLTYTFGAAGKIKKVDDGNNNFINVNYNNETTQDYIIGIENNSGYRYEFTYERILNDAEEINSLSKISYQRKISNETEDYETICINDTPIEISYEYIVLSDDIIALSKVTYPHDLETPENEKLTVEYLYDNGRLVGIVDIDKRKLEISYTYQLDDNDLSVKLDNYPSASCFKELVLNKSYTEDIPDGEQYLEIPKSSLRIDRRNTYHRIFENELNEIEVLHYTKDFKLLYYTNNEGKDFYADYSWEDGEGYISQIVSPENHVQNPKFYNPNFEHLDENDELNAWSGTGLIKGSDTINGQYCAEFSGLIGDSKYASQKVEIDGNEGDIFVVGGYAKATASVPSEKQIFGIEVYKVKISGRRETIGELLYRLDFDPTMDGEVQFRLGAFKLNEDVQKVYYKIVYAYQTGEAYFDDVLLYKSSGSVDFFNAPVTENTNDETDSTIISSEPSNPNDEERNVDSNEKYNTEEFTDDNNITTFFDYSKDTGFLEQKRVETDNNSSYIVDKYSYDAMGALTEVLRVVGYTGNVVNEDSEIKNTTNYEYEYGKISSVVHNNMFYKFNYTSYGDLENITVDLNSTDDLDPTQEQKIPLISYDYTSDEYRNINTITYSNGKVLKYVYEDNLVKSIYDGLDTLSDPIFSYEYDEDGNINKITDNIANRVIEYSNDSIEVYELVSSNGTEVEKLLYSKNKVENNSEDVYEEFNVLSVSYSKTTESPTYDSESQTTSYSSSISMNDDYPIVFESRAVCDYIGRVKSSSITYTDENGIDTYSVVNESSYKTYVTQLDNTDNTTDTNLLETYKSTISIKNSTSSTEDTEFISTYNYDSAGRITHIYYEDNAGNSVPAFYYAYDIAGQLVKEADFLGKTYTEYIYDNYGNITDKIIYSGDIHLNDDNKTVNTTGTTSKTINFEYLESHRDVIRRIRFDDCGYKHIDIDRYGNPEDYYRLVDEDVEEFYLTWSGNQLQSVRPKNDDIIYEYKYDDEGRRTQKFYYSNYTDSYPTGRELVMKTDYIWNDNILVGYRIYFGDLGTPVTIEAVILYDELNEPIGLRYNMDGLTNSDEDLDFAEEDIFWFIKDGQGNVKAIYSEKTNYTIGCNYINGQLSIDFTDSFVKDLDELLSGIEDTKEVWRVFFAFVITLQQAPLISMDASHATPHSYIFDPETGLYYYQNKYYSPEYGRFINVGNVEEIVYDLENPFCSNPFVYYNNDPINRRETLMKSKSSSTAVGIQAELSKSIFSFSDSVGIEFVYDPIKDELYAYYYSDAKTNIDYTSRAIKHIENVLGSIPFFAATSLNGLASNFKINNSLSLSYFSVQHNKSFAWPNSYINQARVKPKETNGYRGYTVYGGGYQSKGVCFYPTTNIGFAFNDLTVKYTKLEVDFPALKNYLATNRNNIIAATK